MLFYSSVTFFKNSFHYLNWKLFVKHQVKVKLCSDELGEVHLWKVKGNRGREWRKGSWSYSSETTIE
jgi:hypothetical protein